MNKKCLEFNFTHAIQLKKGFMRYRQFSERLMRYNALVTLSSSVIAKVTRYTMCVHSNKYYGLVKVS